MYLTPGDLAQFPAAPSRPIRPFVNGPRTEAETRPPRTRCACGFSASGSPAGGGLGGRVLQRRSVLRSEPAPQTPADQHDDAGRISAAISPRMSLARKAASSAGNGNCASSPPRSIIQCQPVWATRAERMMMPIRSATACRKSQREGGHEHEQQKHLADLDAEIEGEQRGDEMVAGELERVAQEEREAEAVHDAEGEGDHPAPLDGGCRRCSPAPCRRWWRRSASRSAAGTRARPARSRRRRRSARSNAPP